MVLQRNQPFPPQRCVAQEAPPEGHISRCTRDQSIPVDKMTVWLSIVCSVMKILQARSFIDGEGALAQTCIPIKCTTATLQLCEEL